MDIIAAGKLYDLLRRDNEYSTDARYERAMASKLQLRARRRMGLRDATVSHTEWNLDGLPDSAIDSGDITDAEYDDLCQADVTVTGHDAGGNTVHILAQISFVVEPVDITRAARRAALLRKATGQRVRAAVIGCGATPETEVAAGRYDVAVIIVATGQGEGSGPEERAAIRRGAPTPEQ